MGTPTDEHDQHDQHVMKRLGGGRSGQVFLLKQGQRLIARKVFGAEDRLAKLVQYLAFGAPNPYAWDEAAIRCAVLRRTILAQLVAVWFGPRLQVAAAYGYSWNRDHHAWQIDTEYVPGRPPALYHPLRTPTDERHALVHTILNPLQQHLIAAGFDGAVWQAGLGNPVALNNFLLLDDTPPYRFCFIDLESGVPALAPLNPLRLLTFYLPKSVHHGRPLFDDVDVPKLRQYVANHDAALRRRLGAERVKQLVEQIDQLDDAQRQWKATTRTERSIAYQRKKDRLSAAQAAWYRDHPLRWYLREAGRALRQLGYAAAVKVPRQAARWLANVDVRAVLTRWWTLITSLKARAEFARGRVQERMDVWRDRGQLADDDYDTLRAELDTAEASTYMTDFGAHIGMKAAATVLELLVFSSLFAAGVIGGAILVAVIAADGIIYRTLYTLVRSVHAARRLQSPPWVALGVGLLPLIGSLAYPAQMIWSAAGQGDRVARFIVVDTITRLGTSLPIWGGQDTDTEQFFNRLAYRLVGRGDAATEATPADERLPLAAPANLSHTL
jgi:hypothetical protein